MLLTEFIKTMTFAEASSMEYITTILKSDTPGLHIFILYFIPQGIKYKSANNLCMLFFEP
ncbi:putative ORFan [Tupanvirus deep ocean]|uniref:ORFan n=2 Tax=Tupanvirus TaxID=2094720 RepID=A0AC62AA61_9VIRU|nr:putative ORFan [Tupanvirus deep ocean]QKU34563.1 putative ORFan [Tupanvirus deep ocean]